MWQDEQILGLVVSATPILLQSLKSATVLITLRRQLQCHWFFFGSTVKLNVN